jgi:hypothetical protein
MQVRLGPPDHAGRVSSGGSAHQPGRNSARHQAFIHAALVAADAIRRGDAVWRPGKGWDPLVAELAGTVPVTLAR